MAGYPPPPRAPAGYGYDTPYRRGDRILDLIMQGGDIAAQGADRSGRIWGGAVQGLGQVAGQALDQYGQAKAATQMAKRDAAWISYVNEGTWMEDPKAAYQRALSVFGPKDGPVQFQALNGAMTLIQNKRDPKKDLEAVGQTVRGFRAFPPEARAQVWEPTRALVVKAFPEFASQIPEQYDHKAFEEVLAPALGEMLGKKNEEFTLGPGEKRFRGNTEIAAGAAPAAKTHMVMVPGPGGQPVQRLATEEELAKGVQAYRAPVAPPQPAQPSYQAKEVLDDDGRPVLANFDSRSGRYLDAAGQPIKNPRPVPGAAAMSESLKFKQAKPVLAVVSDLSERINTLQGVYAKAAGEAEKAKARVNLNDDVAEYESVVEGFAPLVARAVGHVGVLTQRDVDSVKQMFPKPGDSKSLRDRKVARIMDLMGNLEASSLVAPKVGEERREGAPVKPGSKAEYDKLPSGTPFVAPDGSVRIKP